MADTGKRVLNFSAGPAKLPEEVSNKLISRQTFVFSSLGLFVSGQRPSFLYCPIASPFLSTYFEIFGGKFSRI